jgi:plastocyanin
MLLVVLMVGSASAAPLLSVGSNANYQLNASMQSTQSCNATPARYNQTACGPPRPMELINIYDDLACVPSGTGCGFSPANITVAPGTTVMWFNRGGVTHTVTACTTNIIPSACPAGLNNPSLPGFDSGNLPSKTSFSFTFDIKGNYSYFCMIHPWMRGRVTVANPTWPIPTPILSSFMPTIRLAGSVNWTAIGLDNSNAVLNVSHEVSIIASAGPFSFTPATETGSFSQSIDLSTRVESAGTATSTVLGILEKMLSYYPGYYGYYGYPSSLGQLLSSQKERYTFWWVNGPLSNGQPVEILTGYASVTGSEFVSLGPGNNRNAWIVESTLSQSLSTTSPPVITAGGSSDSSFKLDLRFDYDQASDLLLKASVVVSVTSAQSQGYNPGDYLCGPSGCFPVSDHVTVNHHMSATVPVTLQLKSTSLDLAKRSPQGSTGNGQSSGGQGGSSTSTLPPAMSLWVYTGIGIVGAGVVGSLAWLLRHRGKFTAPVAQPGPLPSPSPAVTGA